MKNKKGIILILTAFTLTLSPLSVVAHTHQWGSPYVANITYDTSRVSQSRCAIKNVFNAQQCLTCGTSKIYLANRIQLAHVFSGKTCINCGWSAPIIAR